jgi:hypothetical protein
MNNIDFFSHTIETMLLVQDNFEEILKYLSRPNDIYNIMRTCKDWYHYINEICKYQDITHHFKITIILEITYIFQNGKYLLKSVKDINEENTASFDTCDLSEMCEQLSNGIMDGLYIFPIIAEFTVGYFDKFIGNYDKYKEIINKYIKFDEKLYIYMNFDHDEIGKYLTIFHKYFGGKVITFNVEFPLSRGGWSDSDDCELTLSARKYDNIDF